MINVFLPMSGNVGDTLNVMPVLSGIFKSTGHKIVLAVSNKMRMFNGFVEFMEMQPCIAKLQFASDTYMNEYYFWLTLPDTFSRHPNRPWETVRYEENFRSRYNIDFEVDDNFELVVPDIDVDIDKFIVGDRMYHNQMDQRRSFNVLQSSGKLPLDLCHFLDYNQPMAYNAALIKTSTKPFISTFTGISVISDLLKKETIVLWGDDLTNWDNKPIEHSFNQHFYRDRSSRLMYLGDFSMEQLTRNEIQ